MRIAIRKVWRDLWRNKGRTLLVVVSIAVGVMALGMTLSSSQMMSRQLSLSQQAMQPSHGIVFLAGAAVQDTVDGLESLPEVAFVEGIMSTGIRWKSSPDAEWRDGTMKALDFETQQFDLIELKDGQWPKRNAAAVAYNHIVPFQMPSIGGEIYLEINERERPVQVSGAVRDPFILSPPFELNPTFYVHPDFYRKIVGSVYFVQLRFTVPEYSPENVTAASDAIENHLQKQNIPVIITQEMEPDKHFAQSTMDGINLVLTVMAIASLGLSTFLIINIMNALLVQQVPQIGIMKTIGGLSRQIATVYLSGTIVYGTLGLLVAIPLGMVAGGLMTQWMLGLLNVPTVAFKIFPLAFALQLGSGLLTPLLAALWPVYRGVAISVREAVSEYGIGQGKYGTRFFDRLLGKVRGLPRMFILTLRNAFRRPGRVAMTEITMIVAGAVFMIVLSTQQAFTTFVDDIFAAFGFDVIVVFEQFQRIDEIVPIIESRPNVDTAEMWIFYSGIVKIPGEDEYEVIIRGVPQDTEMFHAEVTEGRDLLPGDGHAILLNQKLAGEMGVSAGDQIVLDLGDEGESIWTVVGLIIDLGAGPEQNTAYMYRDVLGAELNTIGRGLVAEITSTRKNVQTMDAIEKDMREYFDSQGVGVSDVQSILQFKESANAQFDLITNVLMIMVVLIALVGSLGLSGTLSINVFERRREIGVMRAVGASSWDVGRVYVGEGLLLGLLSWLQAIPLSIIGGKIFVEALGNILEIPFEYSFTPRSVTIWFIVVLVLSIVASWLPARRATRISVNESLAYQ